MTIEQAHAFIQWCLTERAYIQDKEQWPKYNQALAILKEAK